MSWTVAVGVDTHKQTHTACALDALGRPLGALSIRVNADGYRGVGVVFLLQKNWPDAIPPLEKAVLIEPENIQGHIWLAQAYSNSGDVDKAKGEFNKVFDIDPNNQDAVRGMDYIRKYEEQKAMKAAKAGSGTQGSASQTEAPKQGTTVKKGGAAKKSGATP